MRSCRRHGPATTATVPRPVARVCSLRLVCALPSLRPPPHTPHLPRRRLPPSPSATHVPLPLSRIRRLRTCRRPVPPRRRRAPLPLVVPLRPRCPPRHLAQHPLIVRPLARAVVPPQRGLPHARGAQARRSERGRGRGELGGETRRDEASGEGRAGRAVCCGDSAGRWRVGERGRGGGRAGGGCGGAGRGLEDEGAQAQLVSLPCSRSSSSSFPYTADAMFSRSVTLESLDKTPEGVLDESASLVLPGSQRATHSFCPSAIAPCADPARAQFSRRSPPHPTAPSSARSPSPPRPSPSRSPYSPPRR